MFRNLSKIVNHIIQINMQRDAIVEDNTHTILVSYLVDS